MSIIRLNIADTFQTDSTEYDILTNAALGIKGVPGAVVEIGTRRGGSAALIINALRQNQDTRRSFFCIDPYGNIEYEYTAVALAKHYPGQFNIQDPTSTEKVAAVRLDYTNNMRNRVIPALYYCAYEAGLNFQFFCLEDTEFFKAFADGVPTYNDHKEIVNQYALVFFDGPHTTEAVTTEVEFFIPRSVSGTRFVFDDEWMYDYAKIDKILQSAGFVLERRGSVKSEWKKL